jgi:hypothetical protein
VYGFKSFFISQIPDGSGFDKSDLPGDKKRVKVTAALKECDLVLLVIDPSSQDFETKKIILEESLRKE